MDIRCIIAIDISVQIRKELGELIGILTKHNADVKWVTADNIHLTLKFLGYTPENLLPKISESLATAISSYEPFYIRIYGTGVFPNRRNPRVIWVGLEDSGILKTLKSDIEKSMSSLGYQREDKEFRPHLTLGRVRSNKGMIGIENELDNFREKDFGTLQVDRVKLMKSDLNPKGAEYTCLYDMMFRRK